jgi:histidinol-phosphatase
MAFTIEEDLAFALELAALADVITLDRYQALDLVVTTKPDNTPVTDADKATETAIRSHISSKRPDDGIIGEEFGSATKEVEGALHDRYWVIDPIDGTKNFLRGVPTWATLIALVEKHSDGTEEVVIGVVSSPALFRRWHASRGSGSFVSVNGAMAEKISVSKVSQISDASIAYSDFEGWGDRLAPFQELLTSAWRTRGMGDFWSHMLVAEGAVDVAIEPSLALWDMAAIDVIVREAGGRFTSVSGLDGPSHGSGLSTNAKLHSQIVEALTFGKNL